MDRTRLLAAIMGPTLTLLSIGMLLNRDMFPQAAAAVQQTPLLIILTGIASFIAGLAIVRLHNVWFGWPVLITAIGWILTLGGGARVLFPRQIAEITPRFIDEGWLTTAEFGVMAVVGLFFTYQGYFRKR